MIIEAELTNHHKKLKHLRAEVKNDLEILRNELGFITFCSLNRTINKQIVWKRTEWKKNHNKKLKHLFKESLPQTTTKPKNIVHNFSSYVLSVEEEHVLSFGLDHHIPTKLKGNVIKTEFEAFFYHLDKQLKHLPTEEKDELKTKLRRTCENYYNTKNPNNNIKTIKKLAQNNNIVILKQDKGRRVVVMDKTTYNKKVLDHLNTANFKGLATDRTKQVEEAIQRVLLQTKSAIGWGRMIMQESTILARVLESSMAPLKSIKSNQTSKTRLESFHSVQ